ncbi:uncharacterized protein BO97DRAFT_409042 [Aspergillus homomorphus CBS 101889]|uniref:Uncharacterized protein n=1 Tax=Aspergillus homomorphus (strain CBS 101889) TaxID=1450537 RepID=A0A395HIX0_ASPHC|nr:hypothetical protein BO97DRAFT_409042 [Aspergillus homomorphus CBS 101889]RAL07383.1 hypothetical protein BO97DRAFT_409042 [Aspergillus homomorphus CBS 101889]
MAGFNTIQRPASGPLSPRPRTDLQLAADAWKFVGRQVQKVRNRRREKKGSGDKTESGSVFSEAETIVTDGDQGTMKERKEEKEEKEENVEGKDGGK